MFYILFFNHSVEWNGSLKPLIFVLGDNLRSLTPSPVLSPLSLVCVAQLPLGMGFALECG